MKRTWWRRSTGKLRSLSVFVCVSFISIVFLTSIGERALSAGLMNANFPGDFTPGGWESVH